LATPVRPHGRHLDDIFATGAFSPSWT
jgi:hypothetical protein